MTEVGKKPEVSFTKVSSRVNSKFLSKTITFHCPVEYTDSYQIPIYISGYVETKSGKRIGQASFEFSPGFRFNEQINGFAYEAKRVSTEVLLHLELNRLDLEEIETQREHEQEKAVFLNLSFKCLYKENKLQQNAVYYTSSEFSHWYRISQSDWIQYYATQLGIGEFILLELRIPEFLNTNSDWYEEVNRAINSLERMKSDIVRCDWNSVIEQSRKFFEIFYVRPGNNKPDVLQKKEKLKKLFDSSNISDETFDYLLNGISNFFDFSSKYVHELDRKLNFNPVISPRKENAYFIFTHCSNFLKMVIAKIR